MFALLPVVFTDGKERYIRACETSGESNKHRYVITTQSHPLRVTLRAVPGVPIVHVNRAVMILEPASDATLRAKQRVRWAIASHVQEHFVYL